MKIPFSFSDEFEKTISSLQKKNPKLYNQVIRKVEQIIELDERDLKHFKNLKGKYKNFKRVHIGSFVLMFSTKEYHLVFDRFKHHDKIYED